MCIIKWVVSFSIVRIKLIPGRINVLQAVLKWALTKSPNIRLRRHPFDYIHIKWLRAIRKKLNSVKKMQFVPELLFKPSNMM